jgi:hypothetical protein
MNDVEKMKLQIAFYGAVAFTGYAIGQIVAKILN